MPLRLGPLELAILGTCGTIMCGLLIVAVVGAAAALSRDRDRR